MINDISLRACNLKRLLPFILALFLSANASCWNDTATRGDSGKTKKRVGVVKDHEQFQSIVDSSEDRLLVFDFYADWCPPCKKLSPMLEKIAKENSDKATFYKINIDDNKFLASLFRVTGIPYVVFVLNKTTVHAIPGLRSKKSYVKIINQFSKTTAS